MSDAIGRTTDDLLEAFGINNGRVSDSEKDTRELYSARAVNGSPNDAWVPVTNVSINRKIIPNMSLTAWMEVSDAPGEYMTVITLFRTNKGMLEAFVPGNTKYYVGIGIAQ